MANLNEQLNELQIARDEMKIALLNKGQSVTKDIRTYADAINNIILEQNGEIITNEGVKLFETIQEMESDNFAKEGDLAIVYREEVSNWDGSSAITSFTFPKTVVLSQASEGSCYGYGHSAISYLDMEGQISAESASFRIYGDNSYRITYTSEDGLTYTRTDQYDETIIICDEPMSLDMYEWSDVCGNFMLCVNNTFEGLFEYKFTTENDKYGVLCSDIVVDTVNSTITMPKSDKVITKQNIMNGFDKIVEQYNVTTDSNVSAQVFANKDISKLYYYGRFQAYGYCQASTYLGLYNDKVYTATYSQINNTYEETQFVIEYDIVSNTVTMLDTTPDINLNKWSSVYGFYDVTDKYIIGVINYDYNEKTINTQNIQVWYYATNTQTSATIEYNYQPEDYYFLKYLLANTQFNLSDKGHLLPGITAYGRDGIITGDGSIFSKLDADQIEEAWFQNAGTDLQYKVSTTSKTQELKAIRATLAPNYSLENCSTAACCALKTEQSSHNIYAVEPIEEGFKVCRHTAGTIQFKKLDYTLQEISSVEINETNMRLLSGHYVNDKFYAVIHEATSNSASGPVKFYVFDTITGTIEYKSNALITDSYISGQLAVDEITNYVYICLQCTSNNRYHYAFKINLADYTSTQLYKASSVSTNGGLAYSKHYIAMMVAGTVYTVMKGSSTIKTLCTGGNSNYFVALTETDEHAYYLDNSKKLYRFNIGSETAQLLASDVSASYRFQTLKINNQWYFGFDSMVYEDYAKTKLAYILSPIYTTSAKALNNVYPYIITKDNRMYLYSINPGYIYLYVGFNYTYEPNLIACQTDLDVIPIYHDGNWMYFLSASWMKPNTWSQE